MNRKQEKFAEEYIKTNNIRQASINAGYSPNHGQKLMQNKEIKEYIEKSMEEVKKDKVATREDILAFWSEIMENKKEHTINRLKASSMLGNAYGLNKPIEMESNIKIEILGADGADIDEC